MGWYVSSSYARIWGKLDSVWSVWIGDLVQVFGMFWVVGGNIRNGVPISALYRRIDQTSCLRFRFEAPFPRFVYRGNGIYC